ncbi:TRM11 family SAM-dependent methyltransferase [Patescibacteria group bacterium]
MKNFYFLLGKAHDLCFEELKTILGRYGHNPKRITNTIASAEISEDLVDIIHSVSGGVVKIAEELALEKNDPELSITNDLSKRKSKVTFCVYSEEKKSFNQSIKNTLKEKGVSSRFTSIASIYDSAQSQQKNYQEYWVIDVNQEKRLFKALLFQNIKQWTRRDYGRPANDPRSGMLPPKIARVMVNMAFDKDEKGVIYDPFCGSGTILAEALMLGHGVVGSDISEKAITDTKNNLKWLSENYNISDKIKVFEKDVAHTSRGDLGQNIDAIVFEPYMGPPKIQESKIKNMAKGLEKLYIGALKNLSTILDSGKKIVLILPQLRSKRIVKSTDNLIDSCENFGYTRQAGPLVYERPNSTVVRRIYVLEKN